ncbi:MAG: HAMP domain-containing histidine kinase [Clostridiales bacterium]|nr:HAMP domain-containing histidine kinase [Clostridiales bacterium]
MKERKRRSVFRSLYHYLCFFLVAAFLVTCSMMLFMRLLANTLALTFTAEILREAASATFLNVLLLSLLATVLDALRRHIMIDKPVRQIREAAERVMQGDFSARVPSFQSINRADGLDEVGQCFNKMAEELAGIETLRTDFISSVSHELKTPLSVIQNYGTLLQQPELSEGQRMVYAKSITEASRRLDSLIINILKLDKLENQQIFPKAEPYDLNEQLCGCLLAFESEWEKKNLNIETELTEEVVVCADPELLSLVWNNLFSNAVKFTDPGGTIRLNLKTEGEEAVICVSDTGCGIDPEVGKHIFEKFYQGDTSRATQGNGLGLALVKRVIDIVDGEISVSSEKGKGSSFTVKIRRQGNGEV